LCVSMCDSHSVSVHVSSGVSLCDSVSLFLCLLGCLSLSVCVSLLVWEFVSRSMCVCFSPSNVCVCVSLSGVCLPVCLHLDTGRVEFVYSVTDPSLPSSGHLRAPAVGWTVLWVGLYPFKTNVLVLTPGMYECDLI